MVLRQRTNSRFWGVLLLMLLIFISYISCITLFPHTHSVKGRTITHSHPYNGSPDNPGHNHTQMQFSAIAMLSTAFFIKAADKIELGALFTISAIIITALKNKATQCAERYLSLRAPPAIWA